MTGPEQVSVNVADLRAVFMDSVADTTYTAAQARLIAAIPESEWEPTDEQIAAVRRLSYSLAAATAHLKDLYAAGLRLP